ncbi:MAG: alpha-ketoglutarate-dependent dioxygenase AlkB [Actinobacteria bacterium]|nr:alpha-ketoglutarate-dependent dioxygenase AlkB [Actinomycetota bacterium]
MQSLQGSLFAGGTPEVDEQPAFERLPLDREGTSWVDLSRGWLRGADALCTELAQTVPWTHGTRWMYDRLVDDPRLSRWYPRGKALPHPALGAIRRALGEHYGKRFGSVGLNYYRDGHDSVAFHADRELRELDDTIVAIVTTGAARPFLIRPKGRGSSLDLRPASGDLLVMGGRCQLEFDHGVPKVAHAGPRISVSLRWAPTATATAGSPDR